MNASRDALVAVLTQHQHEYRGCACGQKWPRRLALVDEQDAWLANHQADALAAAGIHPFRAIDPVEQT